MGSANGRKSIFVTGAASGMGRETAKLFHEKGWFVGAFDLNVEGLTTLEKEIGAENCLIRRLDVTDKKDYEKAQYWLKLSLEADLDRLISGVMTGWAMEGDGKAADALDYVGKLDGPEWFSLFKSYHKALIADVRVFDVYRGQGVPEGQKSVAIEVEIQPRAATLAEAEIEALMAKVKAAATKAGGALRA